jgi:hypothetical protein
MQKAINFFGRHKDNCRLAKIFFNLLVRYRKYRFQKWLEKD